MRKDWRVTGDHPTLARPEEFWLTKGEAVAYADSLKALGYENVSVNKRTKRV